MLFPNVGSTIKVLLVRKSVSNKNYFRLAVVTGGHLTENQLIEIVIFQSIKSFNNELIHIWSLDWIFWDFSVDQNFLKA